MSIFIEDLEPGAEILGLTKTGFALQKKRTAKGKLYSSVPRRAGVARSWDIANFAGIVLANDTENGVLTIQFGRYNYRDILVERINNEYLVADVPYWAFKQLRLLSPVSFEPHPPSTQFPTFGQAPYANPKPYRTLTRVRIQGRDNTVEFVQALSTETGDTLITEDGDLLIP